MSLRQDIAAWDGKSAEAIGNVYLRHCNDPAFVRKTLDCVANPSLEVGATWLLKRHAEAGGAIDGQALYRLAPRLGHWEAKLHVLQCLPHTPVPATQRRATEKFLRAGMADDAKFVRAWAYSGFHALACQYPAYRDEADALLRAALDAEPPSVTARVRKALIAGFTG